GLSNPCIPGGGIVGTDCQLEWAATPVPTRKANLIPKSKAICYEGDPSCDADPDLNNKSCTFRSRLCINNTDPRLATCSPFDVATFEVKGPNPAHLKDAADTTNLATLEAQGGGSGFGVTVLRGQTPQFTGPPNSTQNQCTNSFTLIVPMRQFASGKPR